MDVYSVGVVLYQCIMGHLPFNVEGEVDNLIAYYKLYHENPKPIPLPNCVPKALSKVIYRSLSLDPKKRYRSAREMLMDLAPFSALAAKVLKLDIPINPEVLAAEHKDNPPRKTMVWLLVAAILGGSLGVIAHLNSNTISDELTEKVDVNKNDKKGSKEGRSVKFTGVIATP